MFGILKRVFPILVVLVLTVSIVFFVFGQEVIDDKDKDKDKDKDEYTVDLTGTSIEKVKYKDMTETVKLLNVTEIIIPAYTDENGTYHPMSNWSHVEAYYKTRLVNETKKFYNITKVTTPAYTDENGTYHKEKTKTIVEVYYRNVTKKDKSKKAEYIGLKVNDTMLYNVTVDKDKFYFYTNRDPKYFCEDCRCRDYEIEAGLCEKIKLKDKVEEEKIKIK